MSMARLVWGSLACVLLVAGDARAQAYPSKPIRIIAPSPPGGPLDVIARLVGDRMAQGLGQTVVVENRTGAGAIAGSRAVASAEPDGYTLLLGSSGSLAVTPALYKNAGYDPVNSFAPVAAVSEGPLLLATHPSVPAKSVADLVAYARANPGKLNYGSGIGVTPHIAWGLFKLLTNTDVVHIPYKGAAPAITDLLAGRLHFIVDAPGVLLPHIQEGKLRALAITGPRPSSDQPELPTIVESGYPDFVITFWTGVVAPAGTPAAVIARLNDVINDGLRSNVMKASLAKFRVEPRPGSPQEFAAFIASEAKKWAGVIQAARIQVD
jgi:tripartite-type tricarboxylate transporter receptor subunit TctC